MAYKTLGLDSKKTLINGKVKKRCKYKLKDGRQCSNEAVIKGYCLKHFNIVYNK